MYVDAIFNAKDSTVKVVERDNGKRVFKDYPGIFEFYTPDPKGEADLTVKIFGGICHASVRTAPKNIFIHDTVPA